MLENTGSQETKRQRVRVYIDAFNLYHAIVALKDNRLKWVNMWRLSQSLLRKNEVLIEVNFFTAVLNWNLDKQRRHRNYLAALRAVGVHVHEANFKKSTKHCQTYGRACGFYEEKQTDVAIAVKMVADAIKGEFDRAILITADSDQIPAARFVAQIEGRALSLVYPPGRATHARELGAVILDRTEMSAGRLRTCMLPRTVMDEAGKAVAHMPAMYLQEQSAA